MCKHKCASMCLRGLRDKAEARGCLHLHLHRLHDLYLLKAFTRAAMLRHLPPTKQRSLCQICSKTIAVPIKVVRSKPFSAPSGQSTEILGARRTFEDPAGSEGANWTAAPLAAHGSPPGLPGEAQPTRAGHAGARPRWWILEARSQSEQVKIKQTLSEDGLNLVWSPREHLYLSNACPLRPWTPGLGPSAAAGVKRGQRR